MPSCRKTEERDVTTRALSKQGASCKKVEEQDVAVMKEKANAVEFEIAMNDRNSKLKALPATLLNRMMHGTNSNKFEFMKNPNAKLGSSTSSAASSRNTSRGSTLSTTSGRPGSQQSSRSFGSTITDGLAETLKEINKSPTMMVEVASPQPACTTKSKAQVVEQPVYEEPVKVEMEMIEEKDNAVGFDILFSPSVAKPCKTPSKALLDRLQKSSTAPKTLPKSQGAEEGTGGENDDGANGKSQAEKFEEGEGTKADKEDEEDDNRSCFQGPLSTRTDRRSFPKRSHRPPRKPFGEPREEPLDGEMGICETPACPTPMTCMSPGVNAIPIGVGVGIEDQPQQKLPDPEPLDEESRQQCDTWIRLLGLHTVKCLYSKYWQHRLQGVQKVEACLKKFSQAKVEFRDRLFKVFASILQLRLGDSVMQVYQVTADMVRTLLDFGKDLPQQTLEDAIDPLIPILLRRAGDGNQRICSLAEDLLYWIAKQDQIQGLQHVAKYVTQPIPSAAKAYKHVVARLKVITHMVTEYGFQPNKEDGLSAEAVNRFTLDVVETVNRRVCQDAAAVVQLLYQKLGLRAIHLLNIQVKDNASEEYLQRALGPLIVELIRQLHTPERGSKMQASDSLLALAMHEKVGAAFVAKYVQQPPDDLFDTAALIGRLEVLSRMVSALGFTPTGLTTQNIMLYALPGLQSNFDGVKKAAADLVVACHGRAGDDVWQYLITEDSEQVKELKKRVILQAKGSFRGCSSMKARLVTDVGMGRAQGKTLAFSERR